MTDEAAYRLQPLRRLDQEDLSNNVVHFTGRVGKDNQDVPQDIRGLEAKHRLVRILETGRIRAFSVFFSCGDPVVCFTEATLAGVRQLVQVNRYVPWGIEMSKDFVFRNGGGPAFYVRGDKWRTFCQSDLPSDVKALGTPYWPGIEFVGQWREMKHPLDFESEWAHEREWRVPITGSEPEPALAFDYSDITAIVAPTTQEGQDLKESVDLDVAERIWGLPILALAEAPPPAGEVRLRLRSLTYDEAIAAFQRLQVTVRHSPGPCTVVLEMPHSGGGVRRIPTAIRVAWSEDLRMAIEAAMGHALEAIAVS